MADAVLSYGAAASSTCEIRASQVRTSAGVSKQAAVPGIFRPTAMPMPSNSTMTAHGGQQQRCEQQIQFLERTSTHQGKCSAGPLQQTLQGPPQRAGDEDFARSGGKIDDGAVHVEENGDLAEVGSGQ